ncbi:prolyl oligopeptidase family serine peptidase [Kordia jejudonensis]|uniref:prolyl oligopeptidase family serine peptidase n=1 Tax=Kordia jejudonensis TaxID=1348245 RepID=UPI00069993F8|nr:prolyl oligopeptidase family serine peptidase [Kordia jejudonensis]
MKAFFAVFISIFFSISAFGQVFPKDFKLQHGSYTVGFQQYQKVDSTRTYNKVLQWTRKSIPRPIPISIWYPSQETSSAKTTILSYLEIFKAEREWEHLPNEYLLNWFPYPVNNEHNNAILNNTTKAFKNSTVANGIFPVVIYAPSYEASSIENFVLCEYLASHGYVVISSPSRGAETKYFTGGTAKDAEAQARDIEFLLKEVLSLSYADTEKIATMGFSFGGLSNVLAQMRNGYIKAIVSLDGSIRYNYKTLKKSAFHDLTNVNVPFIHMAQKDIPEAVLKADKIDPKLNYEFEFYDSLTYSDAYKLKFHDLTHSNFSSFGILFYPRDKRQDKSDAKILASYKLVSTYTLHFLNAHLKNDQTSVRFLENTPEENGISSNLLSKTSKKALSKPFTIHDFNDVAAQQQYLNLEDIYQKLVQKHPTFELPEWKLNKLGLQLGFNPITSQQGIRLFQFATYLYPKSGNLYDSLAEVYLYAKDTKNAILNFEKSLALDPQNQNAINRLRQLRK